MSIWKFGDYQAFTSASHRGDVKPEETVKNGYIGKLNQATKKFEKLDSAGEAQGTIYIVGNVINTPELLNTADYEIGVNDNVRIFNLNDIVGKTIEIEAGMVEDAFGDVAVNDVLIPEANNYKFVVRVAETGTYGVTLVVKKKTPFGSFVIDGGSTGGYICEVVAQTFA